MKAIETRALTKRFQAYTAVDALDLDVEAGELFALLGVNGAGKTTTIKMLSCLMQPSAGDALLSGHSILREPAAVKRCISVVPQETAVARNLTVEENLAFTARIYGARKEAAERKAREIAGLLGLEEMLKKKARILSGGMQRRLSIAMALVSEPKILFLDEPTLGLDVLARRELWRVIESLKGSLTIVLTTHYMEEAEHLSDRVGIMISGRIAACGTLPEILELTGKTSLEDAFVDIAEKEVAEK
jgi:ABC-2 type transport system ATP-binding protein